MKLREFIKAVLEQVTGLENVHLKIGVDEDMDVLEPEKAPCKISFNVNVRNKR